MMVIHITDDLLTMFKSKGLKIPLQKVVEMAKEAVESSQAI
jgi:hypothetical protein